MKWLAKLFKIGLILGLLAGLAGIAGIGAAYWYLEPKLPSIDNLRDVRLQVPLRVYSSEGLLIAEYGEQRRMPLDYAQIPDTMVKAFLAAEDDRFFEHPGVDYKGLLRAVGTLLLTGEKRQGGSTITMQVARNFYLSREKTYLRKLSEIFLALRIDKELSKEDILALYLNKIYLGHRAYGVGAASQVYYGKPVGELDLPQIAMIAGLPKAPSRYNPITDPQRALERRNYVLGRMLELGFISKETHDQARETPVSAALHSADIELDAPYVAEMARAELVERVGNDAYTGGYEVYTTVRAPLQERAAVSLREALDAYDQRHGYRGPEAHRDLGEQPDPAAWNAWLEEQPTVGELRPGIVLALGEQTATVQLGPDEQVVINWEGMQWAAPYVSEDHKGDPPKTTADILEAGDLIRVRRKAGENGEYWALTQIPDVSGAFISLDPNNGAITSLVGGYDFYQSKFNRVTQARRQPGSGFKAFIYSAALEAGFTAASLINDAPVVFEDPGLEATWRPENYSGKFFGPTRLRYALTKSRNLVSIRLLRQMGIDHAIQHIARFGFDPDELPHNLSLALGSANVSPLQMARGYAVLANGGYLIEPYLVEKILREGEEAIYQAAPPVVCPACPQPTDELPPEVATPNTRPDETTEQGEPAPRVAPRAISPENRFIMYSMMQDVITRGTARRARELERQDLAGKTGTTNDQRDAWFNGYNQSIVAIAWVGFDSNKKLGRGEVGGRAALPAWMDFMRLALEDIPDRPPEMPEGMVTVRIDPQSGKLAAIGQKDAIFEVFRVDQVPQETAETTTVVVDGQSDGDSRPVEDLF